jgi:hypothetical protein
MTVEFEQQENGWTEVVTPQDPPSTPPTLPSIVRSKPRTDKIVFSSSSYYHPLLWVIVAFPLVAILIQIVYVLRDPNVLEFKREQHAWFLGWSLILIFGIYMVVLPRQVDVRSNGSIGIKTFLITYQFKDVLRAYQAGMGREDFLRPRLKFATSFFPPHRVVIRRRGGKWDLVVTPKNPEEFIQALENVVSKLEQQHQQQQDLRKREGKPDLSTA